MIRLLQTVRRPRGLHARLTDHRTYEKQIQRLHNKYLFTRQLYSLRQDDVPLATISMNAAKVGKLIAKSVEDEGYKLGPARIRTIVAQGKERTVFSYGLMDLIVRSTVTALIDEAIDPLLSPKVYSYRRGVSWLAPAFDFAGYLRQHRREVRDKGKRGVYVLRRDIESYTDTIPVGARSQLWDFLREALATAYSDSRLSSYDWSLIQQTIRPEICGENRSLFCNIVGVPTGQPITAVLYNCYLMLLDRALEAIPGGFYARYSDDVLFAHPEAEVAKGAGLRLDEVLGSLGLSSNATKSENLYITVPGRPSLDWPETRGTSFVQFVGSRVSADGVVGLNNKKMRGLLRDIERRATRTAKALPDGDLDEVGRVVCAAVNRSLNSKTDPAQQRSASVIRRAVTDRKQLAQIDYWIARIVVRAVTGRSSVRAFRQVSYRKIREQWGLISLLHSRNKWGRAAR